MKVSALSGKPGKLIICLIFVVIVLQAACKKENHIKESDNRFPLAEQFNMDGEKLTRAFDEFKTVEGALSLIVCRKGTIIAEEYTNYNMATKYGWEMKAVTAIT